MMDALDFGHYLDRVLDLVAATNQYIDRTQPFQLAKDPSKRDRLATCLYTCAEALRIVLLHLRPFMPATADRGLAQLGVEAGSDARPLSEAGAWGGLPGATAVPGGEALFPRKTAPVAGEGRPQAAEDAGAVA
jgi:methionyl-tRNA synthetase